MTFTLGNSGAPRWYDTDLARFDDYLALLGECGANATEIVLHDGVADDFTARVHILRRDWETVIRGYRDAGIRVFLHAPLTPEFALANWADDPDHLLARYNPILSQAAELARDQGGTTLVLHGSALSEVELRVNERITAECLRSLGERVATQSSDVSLAIELRAEKHTRATATATSRGSVMRIVETVGSPHVGICWDIAHDFENALANDENWNSPGEQFLDHVIHLHVHDLGLDGEPHCPPIHSRVPIGDALERCPDLPTIMEVRWRMAERMGDPWEVLAESYRAVREMVESAGSR